MKRYLSILFCALVTTTLLAQDFDRTTFADTDIQGTARYVAMGGAFAALGGDASAVQDNPAALGVFRRNEVSFTLDWCNSLQRTENGFTDMKAVWGVPQVSWISSLGNASKQKGVIYNNFILQYHCLKQFSNTTRFATTQLPSYTDWMATSATIQKATAADMAQRDVWDNANIGWLSALGAQTNLIGIDSLGNWTPILAEGEVVESTLEVFESGSMDAFNIGWGMNLSNSLYLGASANFNLLQYTKRSYYNEVFAQGGGFDLQSTFQAKGFGFNMALGAIYRPISWLRLALAYQTPAWMQLSTKTYSDLETKGITGGQQKASTYTYSSSFAGNEYTMPMRVVAGLAFQVGQVGLISMEYDYHHTLQNAIVDTHWMRLGTEWIVKRNWFLRAGYAYKSNFGAMKDTQLLRDWNDVRTDMDYRVVHSDQYISAGFGFRDRRWALDIAYQCHLRNAQAAMMEMLEDWPLYDVETQEHRIVLTFAWMQPR